MKIRYLGHACFEFTSQSGTKVITDPYTKVGYELPNGLAADLVTVSHGHFDHCYTQAVKTSCILRDVGKYSFQGVEICGISSFHDDSHGALRGNNVIFKMTVDGMTLCHMGDIGEECSEPLASEIGSVDVLFIPVGGTYTVDVYGAKEYIQRLQPKVVIPMHYKPEDGALDIAAIEDFVHLYPIEEIRFVEDGVVELNQQTSGIICMKRVKSHD